MFAKIDEIETLIRLFDGKIAITPKIRDEISVPLEYGYLFPQKVISEIKTLPLDKEVLGEYEKFQKDFTLGRGELEAIAYCRKKGYMFASNDIKAREFAQRHGVFVISLQAILKSLWKNKIKTKEEVRDILKRIEKADYLMVTEKIINEILD
jgi:rRNA-processing protein FCF1